MPYFSLLGQRRYHRAKFGSGERKQKVIDSDMHVILLGRDEHVKDIVTACTVSRDSFTTTCSYKNLQTLSIFVPNIDTKSKNSRRSCLCDILPILRVETGRCDTVSLRSAYIMFIATV